MAAGPVGQHGDEQVQDQEDSEHDDDAEEEERVLAYTHSYGPIQSWPV